MRPRRELREKARLLAISLRDKHLNELSSVLADVLQRDLCLERESIMLKTSASIESSCEAHNQLAFWMRVIERTLSDIAHSPITHSGGMVHAFGMSLQPHQAAGIARRLASTGYHSSAAKERVSSAAAA